MRDKVGNGMLVRAEGDLHEGVCGSVPIGVFCIVTIRAVAVSAAGSGGGVVGGAGLVIIRPQLYNLILNQSQPHPLQQDKNK